MESRLSVAYITIKKNRIINLRINNTRISLDACGAFLYLMLKYGLLFQRGKLREYSTYPFRTYNSIATEKNIAGICINTISEQLYKG